MEAFYKVINIFLERKKAIKRVSLKYKKGVVNHIKVLVLQIIFNFH